MICTKPTNCSTSCASGEVEIHQAPAAFQPAGRAVSGWFMGDQARAAIRRVRQDNARASAVSGSAAVSRRTAESAIRRHRSHARHADGRAGRSESTSLSRRIHGARDEAAARIAGNPVLRESGPTSIEAGSNAAFMALARLQAARSRVLSGRCEDRVGRKSYEPGAWIVPSSAGRDPHHQAKSRRQRACAVAAADRPIEVEAFRLKPGDAHRPLARREQHARRLDEVAVRAVRLQPPRRRVGRLHGRAFGALRRDRAPVGHQPRHDRARPRSQAERQRVDVGLRRW